MDRPGHTAPAAVNVKGGMMPGALFALPCPKCGSAMEIAVRDTVICVDCDRAFLMKFGHLIEISPIDRHRHLTHRRAPRGNRPRLAR